MTLKYSIPDVIKNIMLVIAGTLILAFGSALFIIPFDLITGGVTGFSIIISRLIGKEQISVDTIIAILTWILFFLGYIFLGKGFALKTLISSLLYPIGITLFSKLVTPEVMNGFFCLQQSRYGEISIILATLLSGVMVGAGCAITFIGGGSTGGTDVIAFIICKYIKSIRSSAVIFCVDALVILFGMLIINDLVLSLLGMSSALIAAVAIDKIFVGESKAFIAHIISDKYKDINELIIERLGRTTTAIEVSGGYSGKSKKMLMLSFDLNQYSELIAIIHTADKNAFVTIHRAHEISGQGW